MGDELIEKIKQETDHFQKARMIAQLRKERRLTVKQMGELLKMQSSYIFHYLRLLKLPPIIIDGYYSKTVTASHLYIIARLPTSEAMILAYEQVLGKNLTSQQTEELVRELLYGIATNEDRISKDEIRDFHRQFKEIYPGLELKVIQTRIKGRIICEIKGGTDITNKILRELLNKLCIDHSGVKRSSKNVYVLE